jgi:hypothetical protein
LLFCESNLGGTVCGKSARTGLWGSGEATNRSTRKVLFFIKWEDFLKLFLPVFILKVSK